MATKADFTADEWMQRPTVSLATISVTRRTDILRVMSYEGLP